MDVYEDNLQRIMSLSKITKNGGSCLIYNFQPKTKIDICLLKVMMYLVDIRKRNLILNCNIIYEMDKDKVVNYWYIHCNTVLQHKSEDSTQKTFCFPSVQKINTGVKVYGIPMLYIGGQIIKIRENIPIETQEMKQKDTNQEQTEEDLKMIRPPEPGFGSDEIEQKYYDFVGGKLVKQNNFDDDQFRFKRNMNSTVRELMWKDINNYTFEDYNERRFMDSIHGHSWL